MDTETWFHPLKGCAFNCRSRKQKAVPYNVNLCDKGQVKKGGGKKGHYEGNGKYRRNAARGQGRVWGGAGSLRELWEPRDVNDAC